MEILTPQQPEPIKETAPSIPKDLADAGITLKNVEILDYLGLKTEMFNSDIMNKVEEIATLLGDDDLMELDVRLGNSNGLSKIDKIYTFLKIDAQTKELKRKEALLEQQKNKYYF